MYGVYRIVRDGEFRDTRIGKKLIARIAEKPFTDSDIFGNINAQCDRQQQGCDYQYRKANL